MRTPILIGLHGVKQSGKDTTASFIEEWAGGLSRSLTVKRRGFADKAKWAFTRQFFPEITMVGAIAWFDDIKDDPAAQVWVTEDGGVSVMETQVRDCMAQFSTDSARDIYGFDHWLDQLLLDDKIQYADYVSPQHHTWHNEFMIDLGDDVDFQLRVADICVITDERFENENRRINKLGGINLKIRRKDAEDAVIEEARSKGREVHRSELGLPDKLFDFIINNDDNDMDKARKRTFDVLDIINVL